MASRDIIATTCMSACNQGNSQNRVSGVLLWDPMLAPLLVLPFNHSSCISVSQDSGW
jgi:hypothetical protein